MPDLVAKIINTDGSEDSFGPMEVSAAEVKAVKTALADAVDRHAKAAETSATADIEADTKARNEAADAANKATAAKPVDA